MQPAELLRAHVEALFTHDAAGALLASNAPEGGAAPRAWIGRTRAGALLRVRHDLDAPTRAALGAIMAAVAAVPAAQSLDPIDPAAIVALLERVAPVRRTWAGPAYAFPVALPPPEPRCVELRPESAHLLDGALAAWRPDVVASAPLLAMVVDGRAAAVCASVRRGAEAHEAGVETAPDVRGRGYAAAVVAAWARRVRAAGRTPLYSTSWQNAPSQAVARKLALVPFASVLHLT